jgi:hypothetical protein
MAEKLRYVWEFFNSSHDLKGLLKNLMNDIYVILGEAENL